MAQSSSLDTTPVTGSLLFAAPVRRLAAVFRLCVDRGFPDCCLQSTSTSVYSTFESGFCDGDVTLEVPWNAPEAYVQLHSEGVFKLEATILNVLDLCDRRSDAVVVRVM